MEVFASLSSGATLCIAPPEAVRQGQPMRVTDVALSHGFVHMGRFAAQYRARYGVSPSGVA